jgi:hypothetical protein
LSHLQLLKEYEAYNPPSPKKAKKVIGKITGHAKRQLSFAPVPNVPQLSFAPLPNVPSTSGVVFEKGNQIFSGIRKGQPNL